MSRILVLGCGEIAWGKPSTSVLFGREWNRGRLSERICLGPEGPLAGEVPGLDWVTLAGELDRLRACRPIPPLAAPGRLTVSYGEPESPALLPPWPQLAVLQARWATQEVGGTGVLVTPADWLQPVRGRQLLEAWAAEGWTWTSLESVLERRPAADARFVAASESWLRVTQNGESLVVANGVEAARAFEIASAVLDRALEQLDRGLASRWRQQEEPESGWYVRQQLAAKIARALRGARPRVELGGPKLVQFSGEGRITFEQRGASGALFRFSSAEARLRYQALSTLRIGVELPLSAMSWWDEVAKPGFLSSPEGESHPGVRWPDRKTVLFEGPEIRELSGYLALRGLPTEESDPACLEEALELGSPLPPQRPESAARKAPAPVESPAGRDASATAAPAAGRIEPAPPAPAEAGTALAAANGLATPGAAATSPRAERAPVPAAAEPGTRQAPSLPPGAQEGEQVTALPGFSPREFSLAAPHRADRVQVWLEGGWMVEQCNVRRSGAEGSYTIEGVEVAYGAIVRIDFEPPPD